uniref:S1 motif domain-containing protein n=1 Tax=viral metagenome TaxID=1070528 RepID=A0A6C0EC53_9ZZZZ
MSYYGNEFPDINSIIFAELTSVSQGSGVYVKLLEYEHLEGFIPETEINKYKVNPEKFLKYNESFPVCVLDIDKTKKLLDLSYKKVREEDRDKFKRNFSYIKKFYNIIKELSNIDDTVDSFEYLLDNVFRKVFNKDTLRLEISTESLFLHLIEQPDEIFTEEKFKLENIYKYIKHITDNLAITPLVTTCDFELVVLEESAPEKIIDILTKNINAEITYLSPKYKITVSALHYKTCDDEIEMIKEQIKKNTKGINCILSFGENKIVKQRNIEYKFKKV